MALHLAAWLSLPQPQPPLAVDGASFGGFNMVTVDIVAWQMAIDGASFGGFNMVAIDLVARQMAYRSNGAGGCTDNAVQELESGGVHGVSNDTLNQWPKVEAGIKVMEDIIANADFSDHQLPWEPLFESLLGDQGSKEHPATIDSFDDHTSYFASTRFVKPVESKDGLYGTRSQIVLAVWRDGYGELRERSLDNKAMTWQSSQHKMSVKLSE
eukprot:gene4674-14873_t